MRAVGLALYTAVAPALPAAAALPEPCPASVSLAEPIARAARRFALPETLIRAVIAVESNYAVFAVSPKGAMGLMQLMPATWAGLRLRYALGTDPFDPCDNILAGSGYLRELLDRYGDPGFLAAYNAGPGRYEAYLSGARPLPPETVAYVARIASGPLGSVSSGTPPMSGSRGVARHRIFTRAPRFDAPEAETGSDARIGRLPVDTIFVARTGRSQ